MYVCLEDVFPISFFVLHYIIISARGFPYRDQGPVYVRDPDRRRVTAGTVRSSHPPCCSVVKHCGGTFVSYVSLYSAPLRTRLDGKWNAFI